MKQTIAVCQNKRISRVHAKRWTTLPAMDHALVTEYEWSQLFVEPDLFCHESMEKWWFMPRVDTHAPFTEFLTVKEFMDRKFVERDELMQLLLEIDKLVASVDP